MTKEAIARQTVQDYFAAFNRNDLPAMLACLTEDVEHHVNQGGIRHGKAAFADFCAHMGRCYQERLEEIVILVADDGHRAAAEYVVEGVYLETDPGLPEAHGQRYRLPAGSFFSLRDGKIARVTTYYNLKEWIRQVSL